MTTLSFVGTNGTLLFSLNPGLVGFGIDLLNIQSNALVATAAYGGGRFWLEAAQGDTQSVGAVFNRTGIAGGEATRISLQTHATQVGYELELRADGDLDLTRNGGGGYITRFTGGGADDEVAVRLDFNVTTGLITAFSEGVERGSYTDGTPLTGGFPGAYLVPSGTATIPAMLSWTDYVAGGPPLASLPAPPAFLAFLF